MLRGLKVRGFRREDLAELARIERASFKNPYPPSLILALSRLSPEYFLVAEVSGVPVGYVSAVARPGGLAHLTSIAVHPSYRRLGVAKTLLKTLIRRLRDGGFKRLTLEVRVSNQAAIALYHSLGFKPSSRIPSYYEDGEDAQTMVLNLTNHQV